MSTVVTKIITSIAIRQPLFLQNKETLSEMNRKRKIASVF